MKLIIASVALAMVPTSTLAQEAYFPRGVTTDPVSEIGLRGTIDEAPGWLFYVDGEYDPINARRDSVLATYAETPGTVQFKDRQPVPVTMFVSHVCVTGIAGVAGEQTVSVRANVENIDEQFVLLYAAPTMLRGRVDGQLVTIANDGAQQSWAWELELNLPDMRRAQGDLILEVPVAARESPAELNGVQMVRFDTSRFGYVLDLLEGACDPRAYE